MMKHKIQKWLCQEPEKNSQRTMPSIKDPVEPVTEATAQELIKQLEKQRKTMHDWIEAGRFFTAKKEDIQ